MRILFVLLLTIVINRGAKGQTELYTPLNIAACYENETRSLSGLPGSAYWQNNAEYEIHVTLDPSTGKISGSERIIYFNNSPDTLKELVFTMLGDFFKMGNPNDFGLPPQVLHDGIIVNKLAVNEITDLVEKGKVQRNGTNMEVNLYSPLLPGQKMDIELGWEFIYYRNLTVRNGNYGDSTFFIGYFYPKIAVYDDIDGWDRSQYTGYTEFYGEQCDYEVYITVPQQFKVWASGELENPDVVFSPEFAKKWKEAQHSIEVVHLITPENYLDSNITQKKDWNTWHFRSEHIPDFAFGTSDKFLWDLVNVEVDPNTGRTVTFNAAYRLESMDYYKMVDLGKTILDHYSNQLPGIPYPYPEMTVFNGNAGMEYPMMCNNVSCEPWHETAGLAYHEIAHSYFPFYVGTNERKYAWMDEGWASLFPLFYFAEHSPDYDYLNDRMERYYKIAGSEVEVPIMTQSDLLHIRGPYRQASYNKSLFAYLHMYDYLGKELFTSALKNYIKTWAGKHPMPYDFYNAFNSFTGQDLNWYWENWFFEKNHADLAVLGIEKGAVVLYNRGKLMLPVYLDIEYEDGTNRIIEKKLSVWKTGNRELHIPVKNADQIVRISLGNDKIIDVDQSNNHWSRAADTRDSISE